MQSSSSPGFGGLPVHLAVVLFLFFCWWQWWWLLESVSLFFLLCSITISVTSGALIFYVFDYRFLRDVIVTLLADPTIS